jgi:hypothetical protein
MFEKGTSSSANAYERREVELVWMVPAIGGNGGLNLQAYKTNNCLERACLKLETAKEQSESLTAALSG